MDWTAMVGLGRGLSGLGETLAQQQLLKMQRQEMERRRQELKEERDAEMALKKLAYDRDLALKRFELGLEDYEPLEQQATQMGQAASVMGMMKGLPTGLGSMANMSADALGLMAQDAKGRLSKGRTVELPDFEGKTKRYFQPFEKTEAGKKQTAKDDFLKAAKARGIPEEQLAQLSVLFDSPTGLSDEILKIVKPEPSKLSRTQVMDLGTRSVVDILEDGTRRKVRDMTPAEIQKESTAPGQTPYNWGTVRDDATGQVFQVDPRSGQTRPISAPGGGAIREIPESIRKETAAIDILVEELDALDKMIDENGTPIAPGPARQALQSALNNAQIAYKTAAGLGVLNGPDLVIMEQALGDPTSLIAKLQGRGTAAQVKTALRKVRESQLRRRSVNERAFGVPPAPRTQSTDSTYSGLR